MSMLRSTCTVYACIHEVDIIIDTQIYNNMCVQEPSWPLTHLFIDPHSYFPHFSGCGVAQLGCGVAQIRVRCGSARVRCGSD
jgi:hypothetical protein